jgi:hypothetical protein
MTSFVNNKSKVNYIFKIGDVLNILILTSNFSTKKRFKKIYCEGVFNDVI